MGISGSGLVCLIQTSLMDILTYTKDMLSVWNDRGINLQGFIWGGSISYHLVQ